MKLNFWLMDLKEINRLKAKARLEHGQLVTAAKEQQEERLKKRKAAAESGLTDHTSGVRGVDDIEVAKRFATGYIDYDFSKITDSKGGFMVNEVDPLNKEESEKILRRKAELDRMRKPVFDPAPTINPRDNPRCFDCGSTDLDFQIKRVFGALVCYKCKEKYPDKYSLLTKTECKEDYLLTDREPSYFRIDMLIIYLS